MKWLLCAATGPEARACRRALKSVTGCEAEVLQTGMGPRAAREALNQYLEQRSPAEWPRRIVSTGFAGSLSPELPVGAWVAAESVDFEGASRILCSEKGLPEDFVVESVPFLSVAQFGAFEERRQVVDMESYALAEVAQEQKILFTALRLVSDDPKHPLPDALTQLSMMALSANWSAKAWSVLRGVAKLPRDSVRIARFVRRWRELDAALVMGWIELLSALKKK